MPADLTSAEIAKSGSYFDDVTRDPRPYGIENITDKSPTRTEGSKRRSAKKYVRAGRARLVVLVLIDSNVRRESPSELELAYVTT